MIAVHKKRRVTDTHKSLFMFSVSLEVQHWIATDTLNLDPQAKRSLVSWELKDGVLAKKRQRVTNR